MTQNDYGALVRAARKARRISQADLGDWVGISQPHISQMERGTRPISEGQWERFKEVLEMSRDDSAPGPNLPAPSQAWKLAPLRPARLDYHPFSARVGAARKVHGSLIDRLRDAVSRREDANLCLKFLEMAGVESGTECLFWLQLLAAGARPCSWPVCRAGFRSHRLADMRTRQNMTDVPWPCAELSLKGCECLLYPQVTVDVRSAYYRLDALVCLRTPNQPRLFVDLEIDGDGHVGRFDVEREGRLRLPTVRLKEVELVREGAMALLQRKFDSLWRKESLAA